MRSRNFKLLMSGGLVAVLLVALWWWTEENRGMVRGRGGAPGRTQGAGEGQRVADPLPVEGAERPGEIATPARPAGGDWFGEALAALENPRDRARTLAVLQSLRQSLLALPPAEGAERVRRALESGEDRSTGLEFAIGEGGWLAEWPSLRVFLLDTLLAIDPAAAAVMGRQVLERPTTADEWALALRNVARGDTAPDVAEFLRSRTETLIAHPPWQATPSAGFLNAFDVLVHTQATTSIPLLSSLMQRKDRPDLAHASFLTLDRLIQLAPVDALTRLSSDPELLASRPEMAAQQLARADLRDPSQRLIVKNWLLHPDRTGTQLHAFSQVFPNHNQFVSHNLLTRQAGPSGPDLNHHDREALAIISTWAGEPEFQAVRGPLLDIASRLKHFTGTADPTATRPQ